MKPNQFLENRFICFLKMHCIWCTTCLLGVAFVVLYIVLIAIGKMEILDTFPHLQDNIKLIRKMKVGITQN